MWVKICGACDVASARVIAEAGADAIGLNFVKRSKRRVTFDDARAIADAVRGSVELVGVVEDYPIAEACELRQLLGLDLVQLYSTQSSIDEASLPSWAFIAVGLARPVDADRLARSANRRILVDACVAGESGGTGVTLDWTWVKGLASERALILAGGLTPDNVSEAITTVGPFGVDVASGVEFPGKPGFKDPELVKRFVTEARVAAGRIESARPLNRS